MSKPIQTVEELDAVLHWRGKHALAIKERDALQQRLTAADQEIDDLRAELKAVRLGPCKMIVGDELP
ncbi:hypothetical protein [Pseudomonas extremaustralis]|uniref:Uncharacterized protein n=1 Tax=Pseudomonas extremaustralis TaxID=359110 RepID=A0A5C5QB08_9PSED|nr:hypothetical protein [Pseudomonas extremaustralis]EZI23347.1 hypothetical protein PE143B_0130550 [Pseudomonas extremaustralis 14-3 substr. 14-3b]TWS02857.1 hypothetical protein FIV36_18035 [Pseudomonas extremaustralis]SDE69156.1 hypothetical protein SAMN05216591_0633 [Pseudomonas extremaustralis]SDG44699.1 hypothetical protein SAMN05216591_6108 [Pseudomonas extremaustralis]